MNNNESKVEYPVVDFRHIINVLWSRKWWMMIFAVVPMLVVYIWIGYQPNKYEAQAVILVSNPTYIYSSGEIAQGMTRSQNPGLGTLIALATSDEVLQKTIKNLADNSIEFDSIEDLRRHTNIETDSKEEYAYFIVTGDDAEEAAIIANEWSKAFVSHANFILSPTEQQYIALQENLENQYEIYLASNENILEFQAKNNTILISAQIQSLNNLIEKIVTSDLAKIKFDLQIQEELTLLEQLYGDRRRIGSLINDFEIYKNQLVLIEAPSTTVIQAQSIAFIQLQQKVYDAASSSFTFPLDINPNILELPNIGEIDQILGLLAEELEDVEKQIVIYEEISLDSATLLVDSYSSIELDPNIMALIDQRNDLTIEREIYSLALTELKSERDFAWSSYQSILTQLAELDISEGANSKVVILASLASTPDKAMSSSRGITTVLTGVIGVSFIAIMSLFYDWWTEEQK